MTDDLRARLHAALTAPHALDALERLVDEVTADLRAENERLRDGADSTPREDHSWPTPGQAWSELLDMDADRRIEILEGMLDGMRRGGDCFMADHAERLTAAEARVAALETRVRVWDDACDAVGIPRGDAEGFVRHHRGNAALTATVEADTAARRTLANVRAVRDELAESAERQRSRRDEPLGMAFLHRATALTGAVRDLDRALDADGADADKTDGSGR